MNKTITTIQGELAAMQSALRNISFALDKFRIPEPVASAQAMPAIKSPAKPTKTLTSAPPVNEVEGEDVEALRNNVRSLFRTLVDSGIDKSQLIELGKSHGVEVIKQADQASLYEFRDSLRTLAEEVLKVAEPEPEQKFPPAEEAPSPTNNALTRDELFKQVLALFGSADKVKVLSAAAEAGISSLPEATAEQLAKVLELVNG